MTAVEKAAAMAEVEKSRFRMETEPLRPEVVAIAEKELRETPERTKESIMALRELLAGEKDLTYKDDDDTLIKFLRPTKFYPESALALMRRAGEFKVKYATHVKDLLPKDEKSAFVDHTVVNVLVDRDQLGRRILMVNCGAVWDPTKVTADQLFRVFYLIHEAAMLEPETQVCGVVVIMDFNGLSMKQVRGLSPTFCMRLLSFIQDAMPIRLKGVHIVMQPFLFNMVFAMFKPFIREKLKNRMFFHGKKFESLHQHVSPDFLPTNYGGSLPAIDYSSKEWYPLIEALEENTREWNSWGIVAAAK